MPVGQLGQKFSILIKMSYIFYPDLYFTTASIFRKQHLLKSKRAKKIIIEALEYLSEKKRVVIFGFVIMTNHIHLIWQMEEGETLQKVQHSLLSYSSKPLKELMLASDFLDPGNFLSSRNDRTYQIWKTRPLSIAVTHDKTIAQKLNYIHMNPVAAKIVVDPDYYEYSSSRSYAKGQTEFSFLSLWVHRQI